MTIWSVLKLPKIAWPSPFKRDLIVSWDIWAERQIQLHVNRQHSNERLAGAFQGVWKSMKGMNVYQRIWKFMNMHKGVWRLMKGYEGLWKRMNVYERA